MRKIKVIIKRPDEPVGHMSWISDTLKNLQGIVGGLIEPVPVDPSTFESGIDGVLVICNEEGKYQDLPRNFGIRKYYGHGMGWLEADYIAGTAIVCGTKGTEFSNIPITIEEWKRVMATGHIRMKWHF